MTITREVALQVVRGQIAGVPSAHVVRLSSNGSVSIEGPVAAGGRPVIRVAQLLDTLLPHDVAGSEFRVPGGLKLVVARALGTLDLPPFGSLEAFVESLDRFAATDPVATITNLVVATVEATTVRPAELGAPSPPPATAQVQLFAAPQVQPFAIPRVTEPRPQPPKQPLTISDIRRARRATGVPLAKVAERSRIPIGLLRQLEWGYFFNWPKGRYGRTQLVRYARAAGLDEDLVLSTVAPLMDFAEPAAAEPQPAAEPAAVIRRPLTELDLQPVQEVAVQVSLGATLLVPIEAESGPRRRRGALVAALAAAAAVTIVAPMWWDYPGRLAVPAAPSSQAATGTTGRDNTPAATTDQPREVTDVATARPAPSPRTQRPASDLNADAPSVQPDGHTEAASIPRAVPAADYQLASERAFSSSLASAGTAMFYYEHEGGEVSPARAAGNGDGAVLRITRIVDDPANNYHVRPSPDGKRIAFDSNRDGLRGVYVADEDGQHVRRVSGEGFAAVPSWAPDSQTLAFVRAELDSPEVWNLWTLRLDSGEMRRITQHAEGQPMGGSWFPDGRRIAYSHENRLIVRDLQSGAEREFPSPIKGRPPRTPTVSPDGRRVVFQVQGDGVWLLDLPGGAARKVLEDPTAEEYTWAPDGKRLAYYSRRTGHWGVWVMASR